MAVKFTCAPIGYNPPVAIVQNRACELRIGVAQVIWFGNRFCHWVASPLGFRSVLRSSKKKIRACALGASSFFLLEQLSRASIFIVK